MHVLHRGLDRLVRARIHVGADVARSARTVDTDVIRRTVGRVPALRTHAIEAARNAAGADRADIATGAAGCILVSCATGDAIATPAATSTGDGLAAVVRHGAADLTAARLVIALTAADSGFIPSVAELAATGAHIGITGTGATGLTDLTRTTTRLPYYRRVRDALNGRRITGLADLAATTAAGTAIDGLPARVLLAATLPGTGLRG